MRYELSPALITLLCLVLALSCSCATSRMGPASIRQAGDVPCFAIPDEGETRHFPIEFHALIVTGKESGSTRDIWSYTMPAGVSLPLKTTDCLIYGTTPLNARASGTAPDLEFGVVYQVFVNARPKGGHSPTRGYSGRFCLVRDVELKVRVKQIEWDDEATRWREEECLQPAAPALKRAN